MGKCFVSYDADLDIDVREYTAQGPDRFYYREVYVDTDGLIFFLILLLKFDIQ